MSGAQRGIGEAERPAYAPDLYRSVARARRVARFTDIGDAQLNFFRREGYLVVDRAFAPECIAAAANAVYDLIDGKNPDFRGVQLEAAHRGSDLKGAALHCAVRKLMGFVDCDDRFPALAHDPALRGVLSQLMDDEPVLFQEMALLKPPGGREKPWHQDCAYFNYPLDTVIVGVWIALDAATIDNGCLHIMPGTHREGPIEHFKVRDWQICDTGVQRERDVAVPLAPGGCLLWHGLLHHGSPQNDSRRMRRALQFHYQPAGAAKTSTEERMQHFGGEVRGAEC